MLPRYRWHAESSGGVNDRPSAVIDRCGCLSLQEANNKEEVKIHPVEHPLHLLVFIQGHALSDPECLVEKKIYESDEHDL